MEPLTIRVRKETKESLEEEASEYGISVSEYVRGLIAKGREYDDLHDRLDAREDRVEELEEQLRERSRVEEKIEDLPDKIRDRETYSERRQRLLDEASVAQRLRWRITGVPVEEVDNG
jgi:predicted RNase H-like nuclease (RuvC/YqgF family)